MTEGTRWRIVADYWAGVPPEKIGERYGCHWSYPRNLAHRRGFARYVPDTRSSGAKRRQERRQRRA
jgi:hypothetical protein